MDFYNRVQNKESKSKASYILIWAKKIKAINILGGKCKNCGETEPWKLCFHHKNSDEKENNINSINNCRWSIIEKELKKCICLCENCHRMLHSESSINVDDKYIKNKLFMLEYKNVLKCQKCGFDKNNRCLDFHHLDPEKKLFSMRDESYTKRYNSAYDIEEYVKTEIDKCIVVCSSCHKDVHFDKEKFEKYKFEIYEKSKNIREIQPKIDRKEVIKLYDSGVKPINIAKQFNASKGTISEILRGLGRGISMDDIKIDEIKLLEYHKLGYTNNEISKLLNCKEKSLFDYYKKYNIKSNRKYESPKNIKEILEYRKQGNSMREIGIILNISQVAVFKRIQKYEKRILTNPEDEIKL